MPQRVPREERCKEEYNNRLTGVASRFTANRSTLRYAQPSSNGEWWTFGGVWPLLSEIVELHPKG